MYALAPDGVAGAWGNKNYSGRNRQKRRIRYEPGIHGQKAVERVVFFHFFVCEEKKCKPRGVQWIQTKFEGAKIRKNERYRPK